MEAADNVSPSFFETEAHNWRSKGQSQNHDPTRKSIAETSGPPYNQPLDR
jgi:hypothetical protein